MICHKSTNAQFESYSLHNIQSNTNDCLDERNPDARLYDDIMFDDDIEIISSNSDVKRMKKMKEMTRERPACRFIATYPFNCCLSLPCHSIVCCFLVGSNSALKCCNENSSIPLRQPFH